MSSLAMSANVASFNGFANLNRAPRRSFAARLAALQDRAEAAVLPSAAGTVAISVALAAVPVSGLAWLFVAV